MKIFVKRFVQDQSGATAVEYALLSALIAIVMIGSMNAISGTIGDVFSQIGNAMPVE